MTDVFELTRGTSPLIVSMPHSGEDVSPISDRITDAAKRVPDCDWHLPTLYSFISELDVTRIKANYARYVIDLNRDPSGASLYPGQNVTELCPTTTFDEEPVYLDGQAPAEAEIAKRVETYWKPYHEAIAAEIERVKAIHGYALLWDAHSIRSHVPRFFEGRLPDFNFGTNDGSTCDAGMSSAVMSVVKERNSYSSVLNGRFKGGFITRQYGAPEDNVHSIQLELSQITYMDEQYPYDYQEQLAAGVAVPIRQAIEALLGFKPNNV